LEGGLEAVEGAELTFRGETLPWRYARVGQEETKVLWFRASRQDAVMATTFARTCLVAPAPGVYEVALRHNGSCVALLDGERVYEGHQIPHEAEEVLRLPLREGRNWLKVVLVNVYINRITNIIRLLVPPSLKAEVPLRPGGEERLRVEAELRGFYLAQPVVTKCGPVELAWDEAVRSPGEFEVTALKVGIEHSPEVLRRRFRLEGVEGKVTLFQAEELPYLGEYSLIIDYLTPEGERVLGVSLHLDRTTFLEPPAGIAAMERAEFLLRFFAAKPMAEVTHTHPRIYVELAKAELGQAVDEEVVREVAAFISRRSDCADFALHGLLRLYLRHRGSALMSRELEEDIRQCILGFRYAMDEPGPSMMFMLSENHRILFHSLELICGQLFPNEVFTNSGQNGLFHALKGRTECLDWLREKGRYGFEEWFSNTYFEEDLLALLTLHDFGQQGCRVKVLAGQVLEFITGLLATHTLRGVFGTTHGRSYQQSTLYPELEGMGLIHWLLFGLPERPVGKLAIGSVALAASGWRPTLDWTEVAASPDPLWSRSRMGLFLYHADGGVDISTYRTRNYMVSGLVDCLQGSARNPQCQAGQVLLDGRVPVFATSFETRAAEATPSYWGGQFRMPKTVTYKSFLAFIYQLEPGRGLSHLYFPRSRFEEVVEREGWLFGRAGEAYVAVAATRPYEAVTRGEWGGRELLCREPEVTWLLEAGNAEECGPFAEFVERVSAARLEEERYWSPFLGRLDFGWTRSTCHEERRVVPEEHYPLIENEFLSAEYGKGEVAVQLPGKGRRVLRFP
jgi:hypothetical protein